MGPFIYYVIHIGGGVTQFIILLLRGGGGVFKIMMFRGP